VQSVYPLSRLWKPPTFSKFVARRHWILDKSLPSCADEPSRSATRPPFSKPERRCKEPERSKAPDRFRSISGQSVADHTSTSCHFFDNNGSPVKFADWRENDSLSRFRGAVLSCAPFGRRTRNRATQYRASRLANLESNQPVFFDKASAALTMSPDYNERAPRADLCPTTQPCDHSMTFTGLRDGR